jgi:hypothetical protein
MPFTFSHPALVLPLTRVRGVSVTGLVAGSVVPDFEKYLKMAPQNVYSHRWDAILWFNLPLAILLSFIFHALVRDALINNLPEGFRKHLYTFTSFNWWSTFREHYHLVMLSIIIGAASHLLWDSVTHAEGSLVQAWEFLQRNLKIGVVYMPVFGLLDLLSSLLGVGVIFYAMRRLPAVPLAKRSLTLKMAYWSVVWQLALLVIAIRIGTGLALRDQWEVLFTAISAVLIGLIVAPMFMAERFIQEAKA